jgi:hypothetical protein
MAERPRGPNKFHTKYLDWDVKITGIRATYITFYLVDEEGEKQNWR